MFKHLFLMGISLLFLTGCWDLKEIEQQSYIIAIGLDKANDHDNTLDVTLLISNPEFGTQQEGGETQSPSQKIITLRATDFITVKNLADTILPKTATYTMLEHIVISEKLAKDNEFIRWIYDAAKDSEISRDIELIVSKDTPEKLFRKNEKSILEPRPHKYWQLKIDQSNLVGLSPPNSELLNYFRITEAGSDVFLSIYTDKFKPSKKTNLNGSSEKKDNPQATNRGSQFSGSAVFKNGKMVGKLSGEETRIALLLNNTLPRREFISDFKDPFNSKYDIAVKINKISKTKIQMNFDEKPEKIHIEVPIFLEILTNHSMTNYSKEKNRQKLKSYLKRKFEKDMQQLTKRTQEEFKAQPFGWSLHARKKFLTLQNYEQFNWLKKYPNMDVSFDVKIKIGDYGRQKSVPHYKEIKK